MDESFVIVDSADGEISRAEQDDSRLATDTGSETGIKQALQVAMSESTIPAAQASVDGAALTAVVPIDKSHCLFHGPRWRAMFQQVLNLVRETIIPVRYVKKVGKVVCVCNEQRNAVLDQAITTTPELLVEYFHQHPAVGDLQPILNTLLADLQPIPEHQSKHRLLCVLYMALKDEDFSLFKEDVKSPDPVVCESRFTLDLPQQHLGHLFGTQGRHIKALSEDFHTQIKVETPRLSVVAYQPMRAGISVVLKSKEGSGHVELQEKLRAVAARIKLKRELHNIRVSKFYQERCRRANRARRRPYRRRPGSVPDPATMKENATDDFIKKSRHHGRDKGHHGPNKGKALSVLEEGSACLHCLTPHPKPAAEASDEDDEEERDAPNAGKADPTIKDDMTCRYHPGYIVERRKWKFCLEWTCCHLVVNSRDHAAQRDSHRNTGCCVSTHIWRPTKKLSKKGPIKHCGQDPRLQAVNSRLKQMSTNTEAAEQLATDFQYL